MTDLERLTAALADRYRIESELGRGGMAIVYLAHDLKHDREVALKVLRQEISASLGGERFLREIHTAATLNHPHIMPLLDSGEADGLLYYAMPYIEGESLAERIDREKQLPMEEAKQIVKEVADGLGYAHAQGIIHRDIKPENIMLSAGHAVIADFGIARAVTTAGGTKLTETGIAIGTAMYMSPEQASGRDSLDARSDLYSLGCVLYETLVGEPPFLGNTPQAVMARHAVDLAPPIRTVRPSVPEDLENIVGKALDKVPADRFQTAEEFTRALSGEIKIGPTGTFAVRVAGRGGLWRRVAAGAMAVVVVAAGAMWMTGQSGGTDTGPIDEYRLAVFPFEVQSPDSEDNYLASGVMNLLGMLLEGAGEISVVDQVTLRGALAGNDALTLGPDSAGSIAASVQAGRYLFGNILKVGEKLTISATVYRSTNATPPRQFSVKGAQSQVDSLASELAEDILNYMGAGGEGRLADLGQLPTSNWRALKSYLKGLNYLHLGHYDSAEVVLREALRLDSTIADAWMRLSYAVGWLRPGDAEEYDAMRQAYANIENASGVQRDLIEATYRVTHGDGAGADSVALDILARHPGQAEAWYILAEARYFYRWQHPDQVESGIDAYQRAQRLHPENPVFAWNYAWALRKDRQWDRVDSLYGAIEDDGRTILLHYLQTEYFTPLLRGTAAQRQTALDSLETDALGAIWMLAWLNGASDSLRLARLAASALSDNASYPVGLQALGLLGAAMTDVALGRWEDARQSFVAAGTVEPGVAIITLRYNEAMGYAFFDYASMALARHMHTPRPELTAIRDSLERWVPPPVPEQLNRIQPAYLPAIRAYLLGLTQASLGDSVAAMVQVAQLASFASLADSVGLLSDLALEIQARIAAQSGRLEDALSLLERTELRVANIRPVTGPDYPRPLGRLLRAGLLFETGRHQEALQWYRGFPYQMATTILRENAWLSHIYGRMGQIYDVLGDTENAIEYYTRFVARWQDADPQFQPRVDSARVRLAALQ